VSQYDPKSGPNKIPWLTKEIEDDFPVILRPETGSVPQADGYSEEEKEPEKA
jgi:hypothetical protein